MRTMLTLLLALCGGFAPSQHPSSDEVLTNSSIVQLVKGGLPEAVLVLKIRNSATRFETSADALLSLKKQGVPDAVIVAMMEVPTSGAPAAAAATRGGFDAFIETAAGPAKMQEAAHRSALSYSLFSAGMKTRVPGRRAELQASSASPVFRVVLRGGLRIRQIVLSKFNESDEGGSRELNPDSAEEYNTELLADGAYKITPRKPLKKGEYCLYNLASEATPNHAMLIFDFSVAAPIKVK